MPIRQRYPHLPKAVEYAHIGWDLLILAAVIINLSLLLFDSLFLIGPINQAIAAITPGFTVFTIRRFTADLLPLIWSLSVSLLPMCCWAGP